MACPACGGTERRLITTGYYECLTMRRRPVGLAQLPGQPEQVVYRAEQCLQRYQEGPTQMTDMCTCGTYAIGRCKQCDTAVCGDHSALVGGIGRVCISCSAAAALAHRPPTEAEQEQARQFAAASAQREKEASAEAARIAALPSLRGAALRAYLTADAEPVGSSFTAETAEFATWAESRDVAEVLRELRPAERHVFFNGGRSATFTGWAFGEQTVEPLSGEGIKTVEELRGIFITEDGLTSTVRCDHLPAPDRKAFRRPRLVWHGFSPLHPHVPAGQALDAVALQVVRRGLTTPGGIVVTLRG